MAELTPEQLKQIQQLSEQYRTATENMKMFEEELKRLTEAGQGSSAAAEAARASFLKWNEEVKRISALLPESSRSVIDLNTQFGKLSNTFGGSSAAALELGRSIGEGLLKNLGRAVEVTALMGTSTGRNLIDPLGEAKLLTSSSVPVLGNLNTAMGNLIRTQNVARTAFIRLGLDIKQTNEESIKYPQTLRDMSAAFAISAKDLNTMTKELFGVPNALNKVDASLTGITTLQKEMVMPAAVLATVMTAFGQTAQQSAQFAHKAFFDFNQRPVETVKLMGLVHRAARESGVELGKASEQILAASQSMAIFGGKTNTASNVWNTFMTSLRGAGVPITQIGALVTDVTNKMASMTTENRAFIGLMSGMGRGRTALGGALQMEINMRTPGGLEKNLESMTTTLARFGGGQIITLEQAANNPQLEMQFVLQRQMLQKLTGVAGTEQQNRILETLNQVQRGGISRLQGAQNLQEAFKEGQTIQERNLTALEKLDLTMKAAIGGRLDKLITTVEKSVGAPGVVGARGAELDPISAMRQVVRQQGGERAAEMGAEMWRATRNLFLRMSTLGANIEREDPARGHVDSQALSRLFRSMQAAARGGQPMTPGVARTPGLPELVPGIAATPNVEQPAREAMFNAILPKGATSAQSKNMLSQLIESLATTQPAITPVEAIEGTAEKTRTAGVTPPTVSLGESTIIIKLIGEPNTAGYKKVIMDLINEHAEDKFLEYLGIQQ